MQPHAHKPLMFSYPVPPSSKFDSHKRFLWRKGIYSFYLRGVTHSDMDAHSSGEER